MGKNLLNHRRKICCLSLFSLLLDLTRLLSTPSFLHFFYHVPLKEKQKKIKLGSYYLFVLGSCVNKSLNLRLTASDTWTNASS